MSAQRSVTVTLFQDYAVIGSSARALIMNLNAKIIYLSSFSDGKFTEVADIQFIGSKQWQIR